MTYHKDVALALSDAAEFYDDGKHEAHLTLAMSALAMVDAKDASASARGFVEGALRIILTDTEGKQDVNYEGDGPNNAMRLHGAVEEALTGMKVAA